MNAPLRIQISLFVVAVAGSFAWFTALWPATPTHKKTEAPGPSIHSPAWKLMDVEGMPVRSSDFSGKVVIINFWATWCGPCRMEIPSFIGLQKQYTDKGLVVVGVSLDQDGASVVKSFADKTGINYAVVLGDEAIVNAFGGVDAIPTTFIIDRNGQITGKHVGYVEKEEIESEIKPLLKL